MPVAAMTISNTSNAFDMTETGKQFCAPGIDCRATPKRNSPFDQRHHWGDFKQQNQYEERHLEMEQWLVKVVIGAFFVPAKGPHPSGDQEDDCEIPHRLSAISTRRASPVPAASRLNAVPRVKTAQKPKRKSQQVNCRKRPMNQHRYTPIRPSLSLASQ